MGLRFGTKGRVHDTSSFAHTSGELKTTNLFGTSGCVHCRDECTFPRGQCGKNQPRGQRRESNPACGIRRARGNEASEMLLLTKQVNGQSGPMRGA